MRDNREDLTLPAGIYWNCVFGCAGGRVTAPRRLWPPDELAALSGGAGSSFTSGLIICAMTGWFCLSCMILVMAWMNDQGWSSSLHPLQDCDCFVFTQVSFPLFWLVVPVIQFVVGPFGPLGFPGPFFFPSNAFMAFARSFTARWGSQGREECTIGQCGSGHSIMSLSFTS